MGLTQSTYDDMVTLSVRIDGRTVGLQNLGMACQVSPDCLRVGGGSVIHACLDRMGKAFEHQIDTDPSFRGVPGPAFPSPMPPPLGRPLFAPGSPVCHTGEDGIVGEDLWK